MLSLGIIKILDFKAIERMYLVVATENSIHFFKTLPGIPNLLDLSIEESPSLSLSTAGKHFLCQTTAFGRLFMGGKDGKLYEILVKSKGSGIFSSMKDIISSNSSSL